MTKKDLLKKVLNKVKEQMDAVVNDEVDIKMCNIALELNLNVEWSPKVNIQGQITDDDSVFEKEGHVYLEESNQ